MTTNGTPSPSENKVEYGFSMVFDPFVRVLGLTTAMVYGVIYRHCQMRNGTCSATEERLAKLSGCSIRQHRRSVKELLHFKYIQKVADATRAGPNQYDLGPGMHAYLMTGDEERCKGLKKEIEAYREPARAKARKQTQARQAMESGQVDPNKQATESGQKEWQDSESALAGLHAEDGRTQSPNWQDSESIKDTSKETKKDTNKTQALRGPNSAPLKSKKVKSPKAVDAAIREEKRRKTDEAQAPE